MALEDAGVGLLGDSGSPSDECFDDDGPLKSNSSKNVVLTASLVDELNQPVSGRTIVFTLGSQTISAATDGAGVATATIKLNQKHGSYPLNASFAGDGKYLSSFNDQTFVIGS